MVGAGIEFLRRLEEGARSTSSVASESTLCLRSGFSLSLVALSTSSRSSFSISSASPEVVLPLVGLPIECLHLPCFSDRLKSARSVRDGRWTEESPEGLSAGREVVGWWRTPRGSCEVGDSARGRMVEEVRRREVDATGAIESWIVLLEERMRERRGGEHGLVASRG